MSALLALVATLLTSLLPILNKRILRDARPALVAWAINAFSLPLLALGAVLLTQCTLTPFSCTTHLPQVDGIFVIALLASAVLNKEWQTGRFMRQRSRAGAVPLAPVGTLPSPGQK
jgi:hypothetical protein